MAFSRKSSVWAAVSLTVSVLALGACTGGGGEDSATNADTLTRAQKDSIISTLPVPGAGAVGAALDAAEKARTRAEVLDTLG